jgi:hypothetical protein
MHFITLYSFLTEKGKSEVLDTVKFRYKKLCENKFLKNSLYRVYFQIDQIF